MIWRSFLNLQGINITLLISLFIGLNTAVWSAEAAKPVLDLGHQKTDLTYARYISSIHKGLQKNTVDWFSLGKILKMKPNSELFHNVHDHFTSLHKIAKAKVTLSAYNDSCGSYLATKKIEKAFELRIREGIESYCRRFLWKVLSSEKKIWGDEKKEALLSDVIPYGLMGEHGDLFQDFLKSSHARSHKEKISTLINEVAVKKEIVPNASIIELISISPELSNLLQSKSNQILKAASLFKSELKRLLQAGDTAFRAENFDLALKNYELAFDFQIQNQRYLSREDIWKSVILRGKDFFYQGETAKADRLFELALQASDGENKEETLFQMILVRVSTNKFKDVLKLSEKYNLLENATQYGSRIGFWLAYSLDQVGEKTLATHLFQNIAKTRDVSYYSILSRKFVGSPTQIADAKPESDFLSAKDVAELPSDLQYSAKRINIWSTLAVSDFLTLEIGEALDSIKSPEQNRKFLIALGDLFNTNGNYLETFKLLHSHIYRGDIEPRKSEYSLLFPTPFLSEIKEFSLGIDPLVILSLMRQESAFNPRAMSPVGARGLMQLMPATARRFSRKVRTTALLKPETNIKIATQYLRKLLEMYDGNLVYTLAAYNAGENRVKRWKKEIFISDNPLIQVELIPFKETRNYVKLIYRNIHFYQNLLETEVPKLSLEDSFRVSFSEATR